MLLFRSLTLGLLGACFLLVATRPTVEIRRSCPMQTPALVRTQRQASADAVIGLRDSGRAIFSGLRVFAHESSPPAVDPPPADIAPTVVDVAPGVSASQLASLVRLDEGEHVTNIDDRAVAGDIDAGVKLAALDLGARRYIDLGVEGPRGARRVLVLLH